ncbi:SARP family transcriptional regulator [Nakamurella sp. YIM 132087]|uniref:SARP family transcriptional regulator n=1 Tax=Nakamurella alba TaxID=2665158 RepID=A0A7K1FL10_9ACTN|nr:AfsR/SARP family transcriptional regulator [Nakamurella alba]MTD14837.1 SARP family transcriptional regulator [Nakamurella alba]
MTPVVGVLGPVIAQDATGADIDLRGPRHRELLALLVAAGGRAVSSTTLVDELWPADPPDGAVAAVRTFVAALRRALEPDRAPRTAPVVLVTEGGGYALRLPTADVDAWAVEAALGGIGNDPQEVVARLPAVLRRWRGPAYAGFDHSARLSAERRRLSELRADAVQQLARARLDTGDVSGAIRDLDPFVDENPWRETGWRLLATALYRADRRGDALAVLDRARHRLADELGLDPGPEIDALYTDILQRAAHLKPTPADRAFDRAAESLRSAGGRSRWEGTLGLLRTLAVTGADGLAAAREQRWTAIETATATGDPVLAARVIGGFDVPGAWTTSDDPDLARRIATAAMQALDGLGDRHPALRARLLATAAIELRGVPGPRGPEAATRAESLARELQDPALLAFALSGRYLQSYGRAGLARERDEIGAELVTLAARHDLPNHHVLGHLVRMQALTALGDPGAAGQHADEADRLGSEHERPLVRLFTDGFRIVAAVPDRPVARSQQSFRELAARLELTGMPGVSRGLLALQLVSLSLAHGLPVEASVGELDPGPYRPWITPHLLLAQGQPDSAAAALAHLPDPDPGLPLEVLWCLAAAAADIVGDTVLLARARTALAPAAAEIAAGSGLVTAGPVARYLR